MRVVNEVVRGLKAQPTVRLMVESHTDGAFKKAKKARLLTATRAIEVAEYVIAAGITRGRMTAMGFGMDKPIETNKTGQGRRKNNRVELRVTNPVDAKTRADLAGRELYRQARKLHGSGATDAALAKFKQAAAKGYTKAYRALGGSAFGRAGRGKPRRPTSGFAPAPPTARLSRIL